ncbi:MAG: sugar ABC transporter permease [Clostridiales bacterium]|nr:sugar ABC transporter permease [Clostridiales bacterium]
MKRKCTEPAAILFMLPAGLIYVSVVVFPAFYSLYLSFFTGSGINSWTYCGMQNYVNMFHDSIFRTSLINSVLWLFLSLVVTTAISLMLAVILNKRFAGRTFFRGLFYMPSVIALIAVAIIWRWIYHPTFGFINEMLKQLGAKSGQAWLSNPKAALFACFSASQWQAIGQPMILFLAGLQNVPEDVLEAARIDGAGNVRRFFSITLPLLRDTLVVVISTLMIGSLKVFDIIVGLTNGGPNNSSQVLASYMYSQTFAYNHWGYGSAIACFMVAIMLLITIPYIRFSSKN